MNFSSEDELQVAIKSYTDSFKSEDLPQRISALLNLSTFCAPLTHSAIQNYILPPLKGIVNKV